MNFDPAFDSKNYIPISEASTLTGYSPDYIGQLARFNKVESKRMGKKWFVSQASLIEYKTTPTSFDFSKNFQGKERLVEESKRFITIKEASQLTGYSRDYIGQLARDNKVESKRMGKKWHVGEASLVKYKNSPTVFDFSKNFQGREKDKVISEFLPAQNYLKTVGSVALSLLLTFGLAYVQHTNIAGVSNVGLSLPQDIYQSTSELRSVAYDKSVSFGNKFLSVIPKINSVVENPQSILASLSTLDTPSLSIYNRINSFFTRFVYSPLAQIFKLKPKTTYITNSLPAPSVATLGSPTSQPTKQIATTNNTTIVNNPVIERVREVITTIPSDITRAELERRLQELSNKFVSDIALQFSRLSSGTGSPITNIYQQIANSQKIDNLYNTAISNPTITGGSISNVTLGASSLSATNAGVGTLSVTGDSTFSGFVGIASTTPGYPLSVTGSAYFDGGIVTASTFTATSSFNAPTLNITGLATFNYSTSTLYSSFNTASTTNLIVNGQSFNNLLGTGLKITSGALTFDTSVANIFTALQTFNYSSTTYASAITSSSTNASIGTLTLGTPLSLSSSGTATTTFYNGGIVFSDGYRLTQASSTPSLYWDDTNHRLGLGTSTPTAKLSVNSVGAEPAFVIGSSTATSFIVDSNGKVGIGTSTPGAPLSVNGNLFVANSGLASSTFTGNVEVQGGLKVGTDSIFLNGASTSTFSGGISTGGLSSSNGLSITGGSLVNSSVSSSSFAGGINVTGGCIALSGACLSIGSLFSNNNASVAVGSYLEVIHNQNTNNVLSTPWVYNTTASQWQQVDTNGNGQTNNSSNATYTTEGNYTQEDMAYSVTLTPSATSGSAITLTLGSGTWSADSRIKAGCRVTGNSGEASITGTPAAQTTITASTTINFTNTNAIASGSWKLYCTTFASGVAKINSASVLVSPTDGTITYTDSNN